MELKEKCPACGSLDIVSRRGHYHFRESGLDNVHLTNVELVECKTCGENVVVIPDAPGLVKCIGESIIIKPAPLSGNEIKFLRKSLLMKIVDFARVLGVDRVTLSRWEHCHEKPSKSADRLIRLIYLAEKKMTGPIADQLVRQLKTDTEAESDYFVSLSPEGIPCFMPDADQSTEAR